MTDQLVERLFEALEHYGSLEGTEAQLDRTTHLLRTALESLPSPELDAFLKLEDATELLTEFEDDEA
jgi:uncharacterized membrane protein YgaE (UPF0421/DUF939 family)